jgi:hypothetical protein
VHYSIRNKLGIETTENWYSHKPATEHEDMRALWIQEVQTGREVLANRPDVIVKARRTEPAY